MKGEQKMYSIFEQLLQKNGVTPYKVAKATGIAQSVLSSWKNGISTPKNDKMQKIADYFNVPVEYLLTGEESKFDKFSVDNAKLLAMVASDEKALRMLDYYMKLSENGKMEIEKMAEFKLELENKKE
ncbi:MAG TPA: helix-turn-helix transcriptional regulator [Bacteroidales bacterium]|nr:helix-turn-helix transcriptional regulator [Bacteroidales bacterium]